MKKISVSIFLILIMCKESNQKENKLEANISIQNKNKEIKNLENMQNNLPYTSEDTKKYYALDSDSLSCLVTVPREKLVHFNSENILFPIKENDFDIKPKITDKYFVAETFNFSNGISCKVLLYNVFGENDSRILNIQLNSYKQNVLIDQLLIDCRFMFENQYYRYFSINKDATIQLIKYSVKSLEFNENGDIIGEKNKPDIDKEKILYVIDKEGKFVKI